MTLLLGSALRSQGLPVHHRCHGPAVARYAPRPTATCTATMQELSAWRSVRQNSSLAGGGTPAAGLPKVPKSSLVLRTLSSSRVLWLHDLRRNQG
jgi:hypothetical protein